MFNILQQIGKNEKKSYKNTEHHFFQIYPYYKEKRHGEKMDSSVYKKVTGMIENIRRGDSCCTQMILVRAENRDEEIWFVVSGDTMVIDNVRLRRGMRIAAFYDTSLPAPAIFPPQYQAELITSLRRNQNVDFKYFDETLTAEDNSLRLNLTPFTNIETANGQRFLCSPGNSQLLVYYTAATFSIPAQVTPQKIIVMCPKE